MDKFGVFIVLFFVFCFCVVDTQDTKKNEYYIYEDGAKLCGANGHQLHVINNPNATDVTYAEVKAFIVLDKTDEYTYNYNSFVCADYSELVHNNAEQSGIKAGMVSVDFTYGVGHMFNVFNTTDCGLIYVDCTEYDSYIDSFGVGSTIDYHNNEYYMDGIISEIWIYW